ncbi:MAG: cysteine desulfurase family protein [Thermoanaerobaculia bacterium]|jgi:cysteine desulfurase
MASDPIYLDYNATTPIDPEVAEAMLPYLHHHFGNPSSSHAYGIMASKAVVSARLQVADLLGAEPEEIVFTSGGTESNNMVIQGLARRLASQGRHIITSSVEHPAVLEPCYALEKDKFCVTILPVDGQGRVSPETVAQAITSETTLISIMHANNEVGTIQPLAEIAAGARERGILLHTDAAQSVGKIPVRPDELGVDFLSLAGHKLYAPKGIGALYIRSGRHLDRLMHGASHESGRRAGTENVLGIVGLGKACEIAGESLEAGGAHSRALRDRLWQGLSSRVTDLRRNGDLEACLPNTLSVSFRSIDATALLAEIDERVAASAGAACHSEGVEVSTVLTAMQVPLDYAMGTVRFSVGRPTTEREVDTAVQVVAEAVERLRETGPPPS